MTPQGTRGAGRAGERAQAFWPGGQNLAAGAIYLPRGSESKGAPRGLRSISWGLALAQMERGRGA